jgi:hypothetical protein
MAALKRTYNDLPFPMSSQLSDSLGNPHTTTVRHLPAESTVDLNDRYDPDHD